MRAHEAARLVLDFIDCRGLGVHGFSNAADRVMTMEKEARVTAKATDKRQEFERKYRSTARMLGEVRVRCDANDLDSVAMMLKLSHARHALPASLHLPIGFDIDQSSRVLLCSISVPDFAQLEISKRRGKASVPVTRSEKR
jgi:hypothetical protein